MKITIEFDHNEDYALDGHNSPIGIDVYIESASGYTSHGTIVDYAPSPSDQ